MVMVMVMDYLVMPVINDDMMMWLIMIMIFTGNFKFREKKLLQ